jgi:hypothetical protein
MEIALAIVQTLIELFKDTIATFVVIFLIWVALAAATSSIQDWLSSIFDWKSKMMEDTIEQMLGTVLKDIVYTHPLIRSLFTDKGNRKPNLIPEDKLVLVLFDLVLDSGYTLDEINDEEEFYKDKSTITFDKLMKSVAALKTRGYSQGDKFGLIAVVLHTLFIGMKDDLSTDKMTEAKLLVQGWIRDAYERLGGSFKRRLQLIGILVGVFIAAVLNVDTPAIANSLWNNSVVRQAVATQASQSDKQSNQPLSLEEIAKNVDRLNAPLLPIGWTSKNTPSNADGWVSKIIGILISGIAAAQGAPYWFDFTRKLLGRNQPIPQQRT